MSQQIDLLESIAEAEQVMLLEGETLVGTPNAQKRHVKSKISPSMTRCYRVFGGTTPIDVTDERIPLCKECLGSLYNEKVTRPRMMS